MNNISNLPNLTVAFVCKRFFYMKNHWFPNINKGNHSCLLYEVKREVNEKETYKVTT